MLAGKVLVFVAATLAVPTAWAGSKDMERAAQAACLSGDYSKGVAILAELYVNTREAIYIFNQGRCFEQNGRYEEAILRFREFQRKNANAGRALDPEAERHIADCQALLDKQKPVTPAAANLPATPTAEEAKGSQPAVESKAAPEAQTASPRAESERSSTSSVAPAPQATPSSVDPAMSRADLIQAAPPGQGSTEGSILSRWWFWTAVGAVVAGGVVTTLLLTRGGGTKTFCPECDGRAGVDLQ